MSLSFLREKPGPETDCGEANPESYGNVSRRRSIYTSEQTPFAPFPFVKIRAETGLELVQSFFLEPRVRNAKAIGKKMAVNIHCLLADETYAGVMELLDDMKTDKRLAGLNAIVFLSLKQKGRGIHFNKLEYEKFKNIIERCMKESIPYGMDSCSANKFIKSLDELVDEKKKQEIINFIEPCEATQFSSFFDCYGNYYPCSFMEREGEWKNGIALKDIKNIKDIWYEKRVVDWRNESMKNINCLGCNKCHHFDV